MPLDFYLTYYGAGNMVHRIDSDKIREAFSGQHKNKPMYLKEHAELTKYFEGRELPAAPIKLKQAVTIINTEVFVSTALVRIEKGAADARTCLEDLLLLKSIIDKGGSKQEKPAQEIKITKTKEEAKSLFDEPIPKKEQVEEKKKKAPAKRKKQ